MRRSLFASILGVLGPGLVLGLAQDPPPAPASTPTPPEPAEHAGEGLALFTERVLPTLRESCFECHGPSARRIEGGLRMSNRAALLAGGDSGPAIVPGDPDGSVLVQAIRYTHDLFAMPPDGELPAEEVSAIARWVELGAPWRDSIAAEASPAFAPEDLTFFEQRIRPGLAEHCFDCHGPKVPTPQSGLRMSGRAALLAGGSRGPALVPGDPDASLLIRAVRRSGADVAMPPTGPAPASFVADLEDWVRRGAPWPAEPDALPMEEGIDVDAGRDWWAFRPLVRPEVPKVEHPELVASPIDAFLLARQERAGILPNGRASRRTLIRRASYGLTGLPPTLAEIEAFERDESPDAWEQLIDHLLASPRHGERWGRHWLDLVRFADSNGYERDQEKPFAWQYRNWVIDALNADMPYDRFLREQLAGDELADGGSTALIATGFYRIGPWDDEPDDAEQAVFDDLDDVVRTIGEGMLGVTLGCARCHDHKFDPFPQTDYYAMLAFLRNVRPYEDPVFSAESATLRVLDASPDAAAELERARAERIAETDGEFQKLVELGRARLIDARLASLPEEVRAAYETPEEERGDLDRELIEATAELHPSLDEIRRALSPEEKKAANQLSMRLEELKQGFAGEDTPWALCVREAGAEAPPTHVLRRGDAASPGELVEPRFPQVLTPEDAPPPAIVPPPDGSSTGRRSALADWIASPANPLTARVIVNRVWRFHFGRGIVPTVNDFGSAGEPPSHPELLDWLASVFIEEDGWSLKELHRRILTSNAYRMSSQADRPDALRADEANELFWRQALTRLEAEAIRDSILMASGRLRLEQGERGFFPRLSREALAGSSRPGFGWELSTSVERSLRSVYAFVKRTQPVPLFEVFDAANPALSVGSRSTTTLATQALALLNDELLGEESHRLALRVADEAGEDPAARVRRAFEHVLARAPSDAELKLALDFLEEQARGFESAPKPLVLRARVPDRLDMGYLPALSGDDILYGPRDGWTYVKGSWGNPYNNTLGADEHRGPAALRSDVLFQDGAVDARLCISPGTKAVGVLVRARAEDDEVLGIEVRLLPEDECIVVLAHGPTESRVGGTFPAKVKIGTWQKLRIVVRDVTLAVKLDGEPVATLAKLPKPGPGAVGLRLIGDGVAFEDLAVRGPEGTVVLGPDDPGPAELRALEALCLTLFNLNEFVYVD